MLEPEKKSKKIKSQNSRTLIERNFISRTFFQGTFLVTKLGLYFLELFFQRTSLAVTVWNVLHVNKTQVYMCGT